MCTACKNEKKIKSAEEIEKIIKKAEEDFARSRYYAAKGMIKFGKDYDYFVGNILLSCVIEDAKKLQEIYSEEWDYFELLYYKWEAAQED